MTLPLEPFTVLDLTRARSGPTCVRQLADMGARVIQIAAREDVEGDFPRRGFDAQNLHRNKRSMCLDLKSPRGVEILKRLAAKADVTVSSSPTCSGRWKRYRSGRPFRGADHLEIRNS